MAATGKTPILLYGSTTPTNAPTAGNLTNSSDGCEIAINVADKNLFFKDLTNAVNTVPIRQSSGSSDGWLSSTNWNTFNSKQTALVSGSNIKTVSGTSLLGSGDLGTIGVGYGGTGTSTTFTAGSVIFAGAFGVYTQDNSNLFWDNTNNYLGVGTATPAFTLNVKSSNYISSRFETASNVGPSVQIKGSKIYELRSTDVGAGEGGGLFFIYDKDNEVSRMTFFPTGGVSIGNTTDPGATNLSVTGTVTGARNLTNTAATMGYTTGAGGTVTQATNKSTSVTLNKPCGQITMNNAALAAGAQVRFFVGNSTVGLYDVVSISLRDGFSDSAYNIWTSVATGAFYVNVKNISAGSLSEAIVLNFVVIKSEIS